jgi:hypothetical protein
MKKQPASTKSKKIHPVQPLPKTTIDEDADELIHSEEESSAKEAEEIDPDDLVHRAGQQKQENLNESGLEDPDDLVHRPDKK